MKQVVRGSAMHAFTPAKNATPPPPAGVVNGPLHQDVGLHWTLHWLYNLLPDTSVIRFAKRAVMTRTVEMSGSGQKSIEKRFF